MPNRILKESICTSDDIDRLDWFEEAFYYRLIVNCDDYGRMDGRPAVLRAKLFPLKVELPLENVTSALDTLMGIGCVQRYEVDGKPYLFLPAWGRHQRLRNSREKYPAPPGGEGTILSMDDPLKAIRAAAIAIGMPFASRDQEIATALAEEYTRPWVIEAVWRAADGPSRTWRYIRGILRQWQQAGGIDSRVRHQTATVLAQRYTQREYTAEQLDALFETV